MSSTRVNGRCEVARPRIEIRSDDPVRLSTALMKKSPLLANAFMTFWPKNGCTLHPQAIGEHVGVGGDDDFAGVLRFGEMAFVLAIRKCGRELAFEARGDHVADLASA